MFELANSFEENLALFKAEAERIDPVCAKILFDNLEILCRENEVARDRATIAEFHREVIAALDRVAEFEEGRAQ
jgi:hypothetical protein